MDRRPPVPDARRSTSGDEASPATTMADRDVTKFGWRLALGMLSFVLILGTPQYLRLPLSNDPVYYDLQAAHVRAGGVLYRDMAEPNLPGVVWVQMAARAVLGSTSEALRTLDGGVFLASVGLLALAMRRAGCRPSACVWAAAGTIWFYFSLAEWCHCQRDVWLLLPATGALTLRERQIVRLRRRSDEPSGSTRRGCFFYGAMEGAVWGAAVWIKPHVVVPALLAWTVGSRMTNDRRRSLLDLAGLIVGGAVVGAAGSLWLIRNGAWPHFWNTLLVMNPKYLAAVRGDASLGFALQMCGRMMPWFATHLVMVPASAAWISQVVHRRAAAMPRNAATSHLAAEERRALWAALYLGWLGQATLLQIVFDYVQVPPLVIAIMLFAVWCEGRSRANAFRWSAALATLACILSPLASVERLQAWPRCVVGPNSPALRNHLRRVHEPDWEDLERVAQFLERQSLNDGDLICYDNHLIHLYPRLGVRPTLRYVYQKTWQSILASSIEELTRDFREHPPRFIVSDLNGTGLSQAAINDDDPFQPRLPDEFPLKARGRFPWRYPVAYRSRGIVVHVGSGKNSVGRSSAAGLSPKANGD